MLPEFIRLDGVGIGYYYTTPHGSLASALAECAAAADLDGALLLGYGLYGRRKNLSARGIHVAGGLKVSLDVVNGILTSLTIENLTNESKLIELSLNPEISASGLAEKKVIEAGEVCVLI